MLVLSGDAPAHTHTGLTISVRYSTSVDTCITVDKYTLTKGKIFHSSSFSDNNWEGIHFVRTNQMQPEGKRVASENRMSDSHSSLALF